MNVRVRLFAAARQAAGRDVLEVEMPDGATIGRLRRQLAGEIPQIADLLRRVTFALGTDYAADTEEIPPGADVACIPPVSGG